MSNVKFEYHPITTMTLVYRMSGLIDLATIFPLLPIKRLDISAFSGKKNNVKNFKIPVVSEPGSILSAGFGHEVRGIIRSSAPEAFKNSITLDISTKLKNINMKISPQTIQLTGAKSFSGGREAVEYFIDHVYNIDNMLREMNYKPEERDAAMEWVIENTKGITMLIRDYEVENGFYIENQINMIDIKDNLVKQEIEDKKLNIKFIEFLLSYVLDFKDPHFLDNGSSMDDSHSTYNLFLNLLKNKECCIIDYPYGIEVMDIGTININYSLGFLVDRHKLANLINGYKGFFGRFFNSIENKSTIQLPCPELPPRGSKRKQPMHSILVYRSGAVTQSGPRPDLMKKAYYIFNEFVKKYRQMIEIKDENNPQVSIKYRPVYKNTIIEPTHDLTLEGPIIVKSDPRYPLWIKEDTKNTEDIKDIKNTKDITLEDMRQEFHKEFEISNITGNIVELSFN